MRIERDWNSKFLKHNSHLNYVVYFNLVLRLPLIVRRVPTIPSMLKFDSSEFLS